MRGPIRDEARYLDTLEDLKVRVTTDRPRLSRCRTLVPELGILRPQPERLGLVDGVARSWEDSSSHKR